VPTPERPLQIDWVSGACMIIRREVIEAIGLLDEGYFLYFEETDFILRARRAGWSCWHIPDARVVHYVGQSTGVTAKDKRGQRTPAYWFESRRRYFVLNYGLPYALLTDLAVVIASGLWKARRLLGSRSDRERSHELRDFLTHSSLMRQRRGIVARRIA
jgi:GT2 family glycosyltransferase